MQQEVFRASAANYSTFLVSMDAKPSPSAYYMEYMMHTATVGDQLLLQSLGPSGCPSLGRKPNRHLPLPTCYTPLAGWLTGWKTEAPHILRSRHSP
ncbi:hypothetical protein NQZ68_012043 [Dissostichus eleginoides]|nr:hypothetical protein NQZ68_012043 [Dissostichus eleginoides]